jgi:hypothetical protein
MKGDFSDIQGILCANHAHSYGDKHSFDPLEYRDNLPSEFGLSYEATEHFVAGETVPEIIQRVRSEKDGEVEIYGRYALGRYMHEGERKDILMIPGIESSTDWADCSHLCNVFLPLEYLGEHKDASDREVLQLSEKAALNRVAHPAAPKNATPEENLRKYVEMGEEYDFTVDLAASYGYPPLFNWLAQGRTGSEILNSMLNLGIKQIDEHAAYSKNVFELADELDTELQPELDIHSYLPEDGFGMGYMDGSEFFEKMFAEEEPQIEDYRSQKVVGPRRLKTWLWEDTIRFGHSYPNTHIVEHLNWFEDDQEKREDVMEESIQNHSQLEVENVRKRAKNL